MKNLTLEHIAQACKGIYKGSEADKTREVTGIYTDSRKVQEGSLFVPIKGVWPLFPRNIWEKSLIPISRWNLLFRR